jgi:probable rRNA maturation factor
MSISLSITNQTRRAVDAAWLKRQLHRALKLLEITTGEWTITIVGDRAMAALHKKTMNLAGATDVLTFDLSGGQNAGELALELDTVLCADEAARRAKELQHPLKAELLLYAIHSLLHVQGHDDIRPADAARMHRREDEILLRLGVGAVFHKTAGGARHGAHRKHGKATRQKRRAVRGSRKKAS